MKDTQVVLFRRGSFIAVKHEKGWWLAQLYTHVFQGSEKARIRWFDEVVVKGPNKIFVIHECNDIPTKSIICTLKVKRVSNQPTKVSVAASDSQLVAKFLSESKSQETLPKRSTKKPTRKAAAKKKAKGSQPAKSNDKASARKQATAKKIAAKRKAAAKVKASPAAKKKKKVTCYSNITLYQNNPLWDPKTVIPDVAPSVNSLLYTRAVKNKQYGEVEKLHKEKSRFAHQFGCVSQSGFCKKLVVKSSWHYAVDNKDKKMISLLKKLSDQDGDKKRVGGTNSLLEVVETGTYNPASLGIEHVRPLTMARGSREGINAFKPLFDPGFRDLEKSRMRAVVKYAISQGHDYQFIKFLMLTLNPGDPNTDMMDFLQTALWSNNREVAAMIAKEAVACGDTDSFNLLHYEVLAFSKSEKLSPFKSVNCQKKTNYYYGKITPLHSAALNPNSDYLKQMLRENPQPGITDGSGFTPIHYAAIASTPAATRFLLGQNINPLVTSVNGVTPLMWAAKAGSVVNIKALLGYAYAEHFATRTPGPIDTSRIVDIDLIKSVTKEAGRVSSKTGGGQEEEDEEEGSIGARHLLKTGIGGMELAVVKGKHSTYTALTFAVECGHYEAVSVLLDLGANPNKSLGAGRRKMFPIHIAAKYGHLEILKCLILHGAKTRAKDRHGLTAFHYAAKFNQLHCISWLAANVVPDANIGDSSGNTPLQYACAEGYILVVKYLVEQLKVDVKQTNSWGMPALEIAFLRQQIGVVDYLLNAADIDINFRDNSGATLVMKLCARNMTENASTMEPLEFLLSKPGIDAVAVDTNGCNALHYLATQVNGVAENYDKILGLLLKQGLEINGKTTNGKTPLLIAVSNKRSSYHGDTVNVALIQSLIKHGSDIGDIRLDENRNILQHFAATPSKLSFGIIETIEQDSSAELVKELAEHRDDLGMNVLHIAVEKVFRSSGRRSNSDEQISFAWKIVEKLLGSTFKMDINSEVKERKIKEKAKCNCDLKHGVCSATCAVFPFTEHGRFRALNFAMKYGSGTEKIKKILAYKPDLNYMDNTGMYPLHHAVRGGKTDIIPLLLEHGALTNVLPDPGICKDNTLANNPVLVLAAKFCINSVMTLVQASACTQAVAPDGRNVLHHIVSSYKDLHTRIKIAEKLLPMVENVNEVDNNGNSYLHHAVSGVEHGSNVSIEMISTLLLMGADPNLVNTKGQTPLHFAFLSGQYTGSTELSDPIEVVSILTQLMKKESISAADSYHGFTPLHLSAMRGGSVTSMHLISHGCEIEALDNQGNTPLTLAVSGKHQSCVLMLVEKGANIDRHVCYPIFREDPVASTKKTEKKPEEKEKYTWLPLEEEGLICPPTNPTSSSSNLILYQVIRHEWQGVLFKLVDLLGQSFVPLEASIVMKKFNLAITLLLKFGKCVNPADCNDKGQTLVHCLASVTNVEPELQKRLLNLLIKFQYSLTSKDTAYKCTPLHYACYQKKLGLCKLLVKPETVNCKDSFGRTPLSALFWRANPDEEILKHLVQEGACLETTCDFNLHESNYPLFDYKVSSRESDYFTSYSQRYTVLIKTILDDDVKCFEHLLELGADIKTPCSRGMTPLMYAAKLNRVTMFQKMLKSAGPEVFSVQSEEGKTVLHYAVISHPKAQLEKPAILKSSITFLKKSGALRDVLEIRDSDGKTVLDCCQKFPSYQKILETQFSNGGVNDIASSTDDAMVDSPPDYAADCEKYFAQEIQNIAADGKKALPDECVSLKSDECEVYCDDNGIFYDMLMTKIDIKIRSHGLYNFYKLQLLRNKGKDIYVLLNKWGRIGDDGQHQETPFPTLEEGKAEFMKIFKAKTKNDWNIDLKDFVNHPGKYRLVSREWRYRNQFNNIKYDFREDEKPSDLAENVFDVMLESTNPKSMKNMLEDDLKLNVAELPFGFIKLDVIDKVGEILDDIEKLVKETEDLKSKADLTDSKSQSEFMSKTQQIYDLTNEIYQLIPQKGFNVTRVEPLNLAHNIKAWRTKLLNLRDMEVVNRIMAASQLNKSVIHPVKYVYDSIGCGITPLDPFDMNTQYLTRSVFAAGASSCKGIRGIYKITPQGPDQRKAGTRRLLFHGISTGALLSILKRGLQNAPFGRAYGTRFGEGIYMADNFEKSLSYAQGHKSRFVLVASVVMGKVHKHVQYNYWGNVEEENLTGIDTVFVVGRLQQDPVYNVVLPCGNMIGMGKFQEIVRESFVASRAKDVYNETTFVIEKFCFSDQATVQKDENCTSDDEDSDECYSDEEESEEEDNVGKKQDGEKELMSSYNFRNLPHHNEYVVKNADNIRLEYLIQIR